jgi:lipoprotein-anchoring transpeptidase ErfK/SrfK
MVRWFSLTKILITAILGLALFVAFRSGWMPVEFGGTQTGLLVDSESGFQPVDPSGDLSSLPTFEVDELGDAPDEPDSRNAVQPAIATRAAGTSRSRLRLVADEQADEATKPVPPSPQSPDDVETKSETPTTESSDEPPVRIAKRPNESSPLDLSGVDRQIKAGQLVDAHRELSKLFWAQPELRSQIQERIDATAKLIYFSPQPHVREPYVVQSGDQLRKIASQHRVPWEYLATLNRVDPKRLRAGQKLKVFEGPFGAVITLSDFELVLHHNGQYVRRYRVCIGKDGSSPVGKFKIINKVTNPQYTDPDGKVFAGSDPQNPLGKHWLDLGDSYGIHGTIEPDSIGKAESRGCIRLFNADVSEVYDMLDLGAEVVIRQ